jgi:hypothetical protein
MKKLIVFDVNETLLDLEALDPHFKRVFGSASVRTSWFATVLRNSLVATITGQYDDFGKIAGVSRWLAWSDFFFAATSAAPTRDTSYSNWI